MMTIIEPEIIQETTTGEDNDRFTHIVLKKKTDPRSAEAIVTESRVMGKPLLAYCGKFWVPQHNPERFPVCPTCIEVWERLSGRKWPK